MSPAGLLRAHAPSDLPLLLFISEAQPACALLCDALRVLPRASTYLFNSAYAPWPCCLHLLFCLTHGLDALVQVESIREEDVDAKAGGGPATQTPAPPPPPKK